MSVARIVRHAEVPQGQGPVWGQATSSNVVVVVPDDTPVGEWPSAARRIETKAAEETAKSAPKPA